MEQVFLRTVRGSLEWEQVTAAGAGIVAWLGRTPVTSRGLMQPSVSPWAAERTEAQRDGLTSAPMPPSGLGTPLLCWAVLMSSCYPLFGTQVTGRAATRGSQGTLQRHVALMGMLPLSLPTISQEGPWQLTAAPWGAAHGESPEPPTDSGGQEMALPAGHWAQRGWAVLLVWQGASRRPGSLIPAGRCQAAGQRCPAAGGPQSGTRHCQQAACCLLDSEIWPQLARIQFNYDKQRLHPLSCD